MLFEKRKNREICLSKRSMGMPQPDNFQIVETPLCTNGNSDVLIRNRWFRVSISTRLMMSEEAETVEGIPFPPIAIGDTLADAAIGQVISAPTNSYLKPGDYVFHPYGWREFAMVKQENCIFLGTRIHHPAAYLGHGWTAYAALSKGIQVHSGDVVFISSGAGAIGSMAAQIARKMGAKYIIGSTGSQSKVEWMKQALKYDQVIIRGEGSISEQLHRYAPDGIDIFVDIVGGEQLAAAVSHTREGARLVLLGALSAELADKESTKFAPVEIDSFSLIVKGVTMRGYSADNNPEMFSEWIARLDEPEWAEIIFSSTLFKGLESAPLALQAACSGKTCGVVIVEI